MVADLGSRNGTFVNGQKAIDATPLHEGDLLQIAGCQLVFTRDVHSALSSEANSSKSTRAASDSHTLDDIQPTFITQRLPSPAGALPPRFSRPPAGVDVGQSGDAIVYQAAFAMARSESAEQAATIALGTMSQATGVHSGAVLVLNKQKGGLSEGASALGLTALAMQCRQQRSYRRVADAIANVVLQAGETVLARNIADDLTLSQPDSRGEMSTTSALGAPIRVHDKIVGILHIYSSDDEPELSNSHLELALAVASFLGLSLEQHWHKKQLASHLRKSQAQVALLREQLGSRVQMVGQSPAIKLIESQIARVAPTQATVLIRGESGVGKELIAAAIHFASPRSNGPFLCLNCAALSPHLLESELFGHEKGAFTGATDRKLGKFEAADGGTLMLDEIGEMEAELQAKFLRVLEGQSFERVGGNQTIRTDVRVVAATNRNLEEAVREGKFRSDLFFRLAVLELRVPPLRERGQDVMLLAEFFLDRFNREMGRKIAGFTHDAAEKLLAYQWPGNIRELKNSIERAVVLAAGPMLDANDIWLSDLRLPGVALSQGQNSEGTTGVPLISLAELEQRHIDAVLAHTAGNKSQAAKILGIERSTLDRKLKRTDGGT
jgi:Nif-specific regulatory protein